MDSGWYLLLPHASNSFLTTLSQLSRSSGSSRTKRKFKAEHRFMSPPSPNLLTNDLFPSLGFPFSSKACDTCNTQCLPGIASLAKAAESCPIGMIFSGSLSKLPSPAYCRMYPEVASTYVFFLNSTSCSSSGSSPDDGSSVRSRPLAPADADNFLCFRFLSA